MRPTRQALILLVAALPPRATAAPLRALPSNPRYFTADGKRAVLLAGAHDGWELQDFAWGDKVQEKPFRWRRFLDFLTAHGHNVIRLWSVEHTKIVDADDTLTDPMPFMRAPGAEKANDGLPKFDLHHWNEAYFQRLGRRVSQANDRGIYVIVMLFQGWSIEDKGGKVNPWPYHPFHRNNNINGIDGDIDGDGKGRELHTWLGENHPTTRLQRAYVDRVIATVNRFDNVLYEIANESDGGSTQWQYRMIDYIHQRERLLPKQHPVGMTAQFPGGSNDNLWRSPADWVSPDYHAAKPYNWRTNPPPGDGPKVILSDSDHLFGNTLKDYHWVWKTFCRGHNVLYMDRWTVEPEDASRKRVRSSLGVVVRLSAGVNLGALRPLPNLVSTGYCLSDGDSAFIVYQPEAGRRFDLTVSPGRYRVRWIHPVTGRQSAIATIEPTGGQLHLQPPAREFEVCLVIRGR